MKNFLTSRVRKSILKKLTFTKLVFNKSDLLDLVKSDFLDLNKIDFLNKAKFIMVTSFSILLSI